MKRFVQIDLIAGLGALAWAVLTVTVAPELGGLMDSKVAGGFAFAALARGYLSVKMKGSDDGPE